MSLHIRTLLAAAFILGFSALSFAADKIDNPDYKNWAKFKPGTTITTEIDTEMAGKKSQSEFTSTLLELTPDKAVVENKMSTTTDGKKTDAPVEKVEYLSKIDKPADPSTAPGGNIETKESNETVEVLGKKYNCKLTQTKSEVFGIVTTGKSWTSEDIPGRLAKSESTTTGSLAGASKITVTALTIK